MWRWEEACKSTLPFFWFQGTSGTIRVSWRLSALIVTDDIIKGALEQPGKPQPYIGAGRQRNLHDPSMSSLIQWKSYSALDLPDLSFGVKDWRIVQDLSSFSENCLCNILSTGPWRKEILFLEAWFSEELTGELTYKIIM